MKDFSSLEKKLEHIITNRKNNMPSKRDMINTFNFTESEYDIVKNCEEIYGMGRKIGDTTSSIVKFGFSPSDII